MTDDDQIEFVTDPAKYDSGYLYIPGWESIHLHPDVLRKRPQPGGRDPALAWHKCLTDQLDNDRYRELPPGARSLIHDVRMLVARTGNGRQASSLRNLRGQLDRTDKYLRRHRDLIVEAGFLRISASRLQAGCKQLASTEERRGEGEPSKAHPSPSRSRGPRTPNRAADAAIDALPNGTIDDAQAELEKRIQAIPPGLREGIDQPTLEKIIQHGYHDIAVDEQTRARIIAADRGIDPEDVPI